MKSLDINYQGNVIYDLFIGISEKVDIYLCHESFRCF